MTEPGLAFGVELYRLKRIAKWFAVLATIGAAGFVAWRICGAWGVKW